MTKVENKMQVDVWSDIMCPFCYIGKRHYEKALKQFAKREHIEIVWHSYQLDPAIPKESPVKQSVFQYLAVRKGISVEQAYKMNERIIEMAVIAGLEFNLDKAIVANSYPAHRLIQMAKAKGLGDDAEESLFMAYFTDGKDFGNKEVLLELGKSIGLTETEVTMALTHDDYAFMVNQDIQEARNLGIRGVPFFIFNRRYIVSGAQPVDVFAGVLEKSFSEWEKG